MNSHKFYAQIKEHNDDFVVEEIPLYLPQNDGQHLYLQITKNGLSTSDLIKSISKILKISTKKIGSAGLKDKNAITTQWISADLGRNHSVVDIKQQLETKIENIKINQTSWHNNKLRTGHLIGNRFHILLRTNAPDAYSKAMATKELIDSNGFPNYFGEQRFGSKGDNPIKGKELLQKNLSQGHHKTKFLLSAYQADLFNRWLTLRLDKGLRNKILPGDIAANLTNGRTKRLPEDKESFVSKELCYTGPLFGSKLVPTTNLPAQLEQQILDAEELSQEQLTRLVGTRRAALCFPNNFTIVENKDGLLLSFELPKGSYATTLIDQFVRKD